MGTKKTGVELIAEERKRQVEAEGWTADHDDQHDEEEMAIAAAIYALPDDYREYYRKGVVPKTWPWEHEWWKPSPKNRIKELIKAGALIAAEIDRLQNLKP
jgi:hypothetical protein